MSERVRADDSGPRTLPVDADGSLDVLLGQVEAFERAFVVLSDAQAVGVTLWVAHTWAIDAFEMTPYLAVSSPTKRSGKSRLLEVLAYLVRSPVRTANTTGAALFRAIDAETPTLLMDEVDAIFGPKAANHEDLRALLNAGFARGTPVLRCIGEGSRTRHQSFEVFCPKALAGIGELPDTIADRSLSVRLKRRSRSEHVNRLRFREASAVAAPLRDQLAAWATAHADALACARPPMPEELDDRAQDVLEPLLAVADLAGGTWPERARAALVAIRSDTVGVEDEPGVRLLADVRAAFECEGVDRLTTCRLLELLVDDNEAPWGDWAGRPLTARRLARFLKEWRIRSRTIRLSEDATAKGFKREQFEDAWARYLPASEHQSVASVTTASLSKNPMIVDPSHERNVTDDESVDAPHERWDVTDVPDAAAIRAEQTVEVVALADAGALVDELAAAGHSREANFMLALIDAFPDVALDGRGAL